MRDLSTQRARTAFAVTTNSDKSSTETFISLARQLPIMIRINGFLATWAHLCAKDELHHRHMLSTLDSHLVDRGLLEKAGKDVTAQERFRTWIGYGEGDQKLSSIQLRHLTEETLAYSGWLKRAVDACAIGD